MTAFYCDADEHDAFVGGESRAVFRSPLVLAPAALERHDLETLHQRTLLNGARDVRFEMLRHGTFGLITVLAAGCIAIAGCAASRPDGVDLNPITSLRFNAGSDFLGGIQRQLGGAAADWSKNGVGYLVFRPPKPAPDSQVFRSVNVFREDSVTKAHEIYAHQREQFTNGDWKLYLEKGKAPEMWFISYAGVRFDTNHGIPMGLNTRPEIFIGILKQNVFIVISYTSFRSGSDYIQTINGDVADVAELLAKAGS